MSRTFSYIVWNREQGKRTAIQGTMNSFHSIDELIRVFNREKTLLKDMFNNRKKVAYRYDMARELVEYKEDRLVFLIEHGVIRDSGEFLELEDIYLKFFEEVLEVNEDINIASVKESIDALDSAIQFYLVETSEQRKYGYLKEVRHILRNIALTTFRNVIDLKRNIDSTYKNEPNYQIKKLKLTKLDEKRRSIAELIRQTEKFLDEKHQAFFATAMDVGLKLIVKDVKMELTEAYHNILELDRQIISYLNLIEYQNRLLKKLRQVKYLKDQMVLESQSNVLAMLNGTNPVWMENRPKYTLKLSLEMLRSSEEGLMALKALSQKIKTGSISRNRKAVPLSEDYLKESSQILDMVSTLELKNAFLASGEHLYDFLQHYNYHKPMEQEDKLVLFCQIASQYLPELRISNELASDNDIEYPLIYPA